MALPIADLLALHDEHTERAGAAALPGNLGDGYLCVHDPFYRRVRAGALTAGFRFTTDDPCDYYAFPLVALVSVLEQRAIPHRDNRAGLARLEAQRPGFYTMADLKQNRPLPNYVLHEGAHAVAFATLFGEPDDVRDTLAAPEHLPGTMLGEAFAMTAEYLSACVARGAVHGWFFSINSYRHRTPKRKAVGRLIEQLGLECVTWLLLGAFLYNNYLVDSIDERRLKRLLAAGSRTADVELDRDTARAARRALSTLMVMSPEFRRDTARLFLTSLGYPRDVARVLRSDPIEALAGQPNLLERAQRLPALLATDGANQRKSRTARTL